MVNRTVAIEGNQVLVALGRSGEKGQAILSFEDYSTLCELGLSTNWNLSPRGYVIAPCCRAPGSQVLVARVLLDCKAGENVIYFDRNPKNLLRSNLAVKVNGYSLSRPRDFLKRSIIEIR